MYQRAQPLLLHVLLLCCCLLLFMVGDRVGGPVMEACVCVCRIGCEVVRGGSGTIEIIWVTAVASLACGVSGI